MIPLAVPGIEELGPEVSGLFDPVAWKVAVMTWGRQIRAEMQSQSCEVE